MEEKNFEELRNQFAILKEQLNKQEIVNDRLLRETMKAKKRDINSSKNLEYGCVLFCLFILPLNWYTRTWSLPFTIATALLLIVCAVATHFIHKPVDSLNFLKDDFATVARVMAMLALLCHPSSSYSLDSMGLLRLRLATRPRRCESLVDVYSNLCWWRHWFRHRPLLSF